ncbi:putative Pentatricopeptide repeat-containing protein, mitochondrial [Cocos nucifera]|uniref:Putative Pentatricopeptide repeat-containing protein, mitochondrial n=1 Tax=Cocos nucifera TaxID=13894 RepID=A0A8K0HTE7_COCNU|nr:putative Pentatricopeptide repeat-containing protein, mitochondrial [Cocos nucifera]
MNLLRSFSAQNRRSLAILKHSSRPFSVETAEYAKRNYANNISEHYLLRDVYDDMMLDGVQPVRDTFHSLIVGTMKGSRLQDAFFFRDQMKAMVTINLVDLEALRVGVLDGKDLKPSWFCSYAIVRDMTAAGLGLNKFCYAGLITAFKNKLPITEETTTKTMETLLEMLKSDGYSYDGFIVMQAMRM